MKMWTPLEAANKLVFQWFFVRLARSYKTKDDYVAGRVNAYHFIGWIVPTSGWYDVWWPGYWRIGKGWNIEIWRRK